MEWLDLLFNTGSVDWLFWIWVVVTIIMFIDLFVPDPIPFIDEAILVVLFFLLLGALAIRGAIQGIESLIDVATSPAVLAFVITMAFLVIFGRFSKLAKRKKKK